MYRRYPEFLPGCSRSKVLEFDGQCANRQAGSFGKKAGISKSFTTRNTLVTNSQRPANGTGDGPFKFCAVAGHFIPLNEQACKVVLALEFEFSSKLVEFAFGKIFNELTVAMVGAFTERAKTVYGAQHG